ncbi:MAG TPA: hypothetical protein VFY13_08620 [Luteolibacter sp.]|nr:hypothetical protein [Luteolibacter sp.]
MHPMKTTSRRHLAIAVCALASFNLNLALAYEGCDERAEMKRAAEEYRRCAQENKAAKIGECEESAPQAVKAAALKVVEARHKIGDLEEQIAAAYDAGNRKLVEQLHAQKQIADLECEYSEREKRVAWITNSIDELIQCMPESAEAKQLKDKTAADVAAYLSNAKQLAELQKQQTQLQKKLEGVDRSIEIIRKREELRKLEAESAKP